MRTTIFAFLLLIGAASVSAQDIVLKRNGEEVQAKVMDVGNTEVKYKKFANPAGPTYVMLASEIFMIKYENGDKDVFETDKITGKINIRHIENPNPVAEQKKDTVKSVPIKSTKPVVVQEPEKQPDIANNINILSREDVMPAKTDVKIDLRNQGLLDGNGYRVTDNVITLQGDTLSNGFQKYVYTFIGNAGDRYTIRIDGGKNANYPIDLTFQDVTINVSAIWKSPIILSKDTYVTLTLVGNNNLTANQNAAGINGSGANLIIQGTGSLISKGGIGGAGIDNSQEGSITILSGTVTAYGGPSGALDPENIPSGGTATSNRAGSAGIGGAGGMNRTVNIGNYTNYISTNSGSGGTIIIAGGIVTAIATGSASGIGAGESVSSELAGNGGTVVITGGTVSAYSPKSYNIGGGNFGNSGTLILDGGVLILNGKKGFGGIDDKKGNTFVPINGILQGSGAGKKVGVYKNKRMAESEKPYE
jgi:hypothetical protein